MAADFDKSKEQATDDERRAVKATQIFRKPKNGAQSQTPLYLQRLARTSAATETEAGFDDASAAAIVGRDSGERESAGLGLIVEDSVSQAAAGQMTKSEFLEQLREAVTAEAAEALSGTLWS